MNASLQSAMSVVTGALDEMNRYYHAAGVLSFDMETICPEKGMEQQGETIAFLQNQAFRLEKDPSYLEAVETLYAGREELEPLDRVLAEQLHRDFIRNKNITPELDHEISRVYNKAYVDWLAAKQASDFSVFAPSLEAVREIGERVLALREDALPDPYDTLLSDYERGMTHRELDRLFGRALERLVPLLKRIQSSGKQIRRDFVTRPVTDEQQRKLAEKILQTLHYDFSRGALATTEHPFSDRLARNDVRVTTHFFPQMFLSSLYSVIHECGHALFEQLQPEENFTHHIENRKTMGMHESVSRFYENILGRSEAFIHRIYPVVKECLPEAMEDVSERELYEAVNLVEPSLIRTEADEFTYTLHIIIRYEMEKLILGGKVRTEELPELWNRKYEEYLGIRPGNDREGILQDVHWTSGFGYFPAYALGNFYNAMYYNRMKEELDVPALLSEGDFETINGWMSEHVFAKADRLDPADWIREMTGRDLTPEDFLDYLEEKYTALYELG